MVHSFIITVYLGLVNKKNAHCGWTSNGSIHEIVTESALAQIMLAVACLDPSLLPHIMGPLNIYSHLQDPEPVVQLCSDEHHDLSMATDFHLPIIIVLISYYRFVNAIIHL